MKRILFLCAAIGLAAGCTPTEKYDPGMKAPVAKKINKKHTIHGDTRIDPYYWMNQPEKPGSDCLPPSGKRLHQGAAGQYGGPSAAVVRRNNRTHPKNR